MTGRETALRQLDEATAAWDVVVIGGGATGLGAAVEAASRGYRTLLLERDDFARGTSSRSTKLVHGGVRYLQQGNMTLVVDALRERGHMLRNAPHLTRNLSFVVPVYSSLGLPYYGFGLKLYEMLSGKLSLGASRLLSRQRTLELLPGVSGDGLRGGVLYQDGQFDDARYAITLMRTLFDLGGTALNYVEVTGLLLRGDRVRGVRARDKETGDEFEVQARAVINATGVFAEEILAMNGAAKSGGLIALSQGSHLVLPPSWLPGGNAMMIPRTSDGRVMFAIPWHGAIVVGTTEEAVEEASVEPRVMAGEMRFMLKHIAQYLGRKPDSGEILSVWSGLRPLVKRGNAATAKLSRDHTVLVARSGLVTVIGGKWTTYRRMGEDAVHRAAEVAGLPGAASRTLNLKLHGWVPQDSAAGIESVYGGDLAQVEKLCDENPALHARLHPRLPYRLCEVVYAARYEMARTVEDALSRRTRALLLDARAAMEAAPAVADALGDELGRDAAWKTRQTAAFQRVAEGYLYKED